MNSLLLRLPPENKPQNKVEEEKAEEKRESRFDPKELLSVSKSTMPYSLQRVKPIITPPSLSLCVRTGGETTGRGHQAPCPPADPLTGED